MHAPVMMLAREIWWRNSKCACLSLGTIPGFYLFFLAVHNRIHDVDTISGIICLWMVFSLFWVVAMFNYTETNPGKGWTGFPCRLFVLPVPTWVLVACPMLLGMASMALVVLAWVTLVFFPVIITAVKPPTMPPGAISSLLWLAGMLAGMLAVNLACFQAIVWSLAGFRVTRMVVLAVAGLVALVCDVLTFGFWVHQFEVQNHVVWEWVVILAWVGLGVCAFLGAWYSVARQRRGGGRGRGWLKAQLRALIERVLDALPRRKKAFASPLAAQCWLEWRQGGVLLPACVGCLLLLIIGPVSWLNQGALNAGHASLMLVEILCLPLVLAFAIGKGFAKPDFWSMDLALKPFLAVRPLTTGEMILAKMKVAAFSTVITWLLVLVGLPLWMVLWVKASTLREISGWGIWDFVLPYYGPFARCAIAILSVVAAMIVTWRCMVGSLWVGLSGRWKDVVGSAALNVMAVAALLVALPHLDGLSANQSQPLLKGAAWALAAAVMVKLWAGVFFWDKVSRQHLHPRLVTRCLLVWAGGTVCLVALAWLLGAYLLWLKYLFVLGALLGVPLARLGSAPLSLAQNRHR